MYHIHAQCTHTHTPPSINTIKFGLACLPVCEHIFINMPDVCSSLPKQALPSEGGISNGGLTNIHIHCIDGQDSETIPSEPKILMANLQGYEYFWECSTCTFISPIPGFNLLLYKNDKQWSHKVWG